MDISHLLSRCFGNILLPFNQAASWSFTWRCFSSNIDVVSICAAFICCSLFIIQSKSSISKTFVLNKLLVCNEKFAQLYDCLHKSTYTFRSKPFKRKIFHSSYQKSFTVTVHNQSPHNEQYIYRDWLTTIMCEHIKCFSSKLPAKCPYLSDLLTLMQVFKAIIQHWILNSE